MGGRVVEDEVQDLLSRSRGKKPLMGSDYRPGLNSAISASPALRQLLPRCYSCYETNRSKTKRQIEQLYRHSFIYSIY